VAVLPGGVANRSNQPAVRLIDMSQWRKRW
jgi:hypothetical protein